LSCIGNVYLALLFGIQHAFAFRTYARRRRRFGAREPVELTLFTFGGSNTENEVKCRRSGSAIVMMHVVEVFQTAFLAEGEKKVIASAERDAKGGKRKIK
jgi:hypothetical protein